VTGQDHLIDKEACTGDGICVEICPENVLELRNGKAAIVETRADICIQCGQCVAVCPAGAIRMPGLPEDCFQDLKGLPFSDEEFLDFLKMRRSVRAFKNQPVEKDVTLKILDAAATAPMGMPPHSTEVLVVDRREELDFLLEELVKRYASLVKAFSNPLGRMLIRLSAGAEDYLVLKDHVLELVRQANDAYRRDGTDGYMYHAPMLMLFHGNRRSMAYEENAHLVCHHAMLSAVSLGLGTTIIGLIPPIVDQSKMLRNRYSIPQENKVISALILGYPKYKYQKGIIRYLAGVRII
jgi:ferredoxin